MDSVASPELQQFQYALEEIKKQFKEGDSATITKSQLKKLVFEVLTAADGSSAKAKIFNMIDDL